MRAPDLRATAGFMYLRMHHGGGPGGEYTGAQLRAWARRIRAWRRARDVYVYFNNDWSGFAVRDALRLGEMLEPGSPGTRRASGSRRPAATAAPPRRIARGLPGRRAE